MGWNFWNRNKDVNENKEVDETKENSDNSEAENEYVSEFDKRYKVDENGNYKYHDTPVDPTKNETNSESTDGGRQRTLDGDDEGRG